jgi:hypothetical protein
LICRPGRSPSIRPESWSKARVTVNVIRNLDRDMEDMNRFRSRRLLNQLRPDVEPWRRDSGTRRRVVLGFYAVLLLAVAGAIGSVIVSVMSSRPVALSDRLAETSDWLAGGTLALAAIAGLVALPAYASATGLPRLDVRCSFERVQKKRNPTNPHQVRYCLARSLLISVCGTTPATALETQRWQWKCSEPTSQRRLRQLAKVGQYHRVISRPLRRFSGMAGLSTRSTETGKGGFASR